MKKITDSWTEICFIALVRKELKYYYSFQYKGTLQIFQAIIGECLSMNESLRFICTLAHCAIRGVLHVIGRKRARKDERYCYSSRLKLWTARIFLTKTILQLLEMLSNCLRASWPKCQDFSSEWCQLQMWTLKRI